MSAYDSNCLFADPFAGFTGVKRFQNNVRNLGSLMEDVKLDILDWQERDGELLTKWRFSAVLTLPWRPRLAASGGTTHVFSPVRLPGIAAIDLHQRGGAADASAADAGDRQGGEAHRIMGCGAKRGGAQPVEDVGARA
jgi:hypothetical protein